MSLKSLQDPLSYTYVLSSVSSSHLLLFTIHLSPFISLCLSSAQSSSRSIWASFCLFSLLALAIYSRDNILRVRFSKIVITDICRNICTCNLHWRQGSSDHWAIRNTHRLAQYNAYWMAIILGEFLASSLAAENSRFVSFIHKKTINHTVSSQITNTQQNEPCQISHIPSSSINVNLLAYCRVWISAF